VTDPSQDPPSQFSIRGLLLLIATAAIVLSTCRTAGLVALVAVLVFGTLFGIALTIVARKWHRSRLIVICGAMIGAVAGVDVARVDDSIPFYPPHARDWGMPEPKEGDDGFTFAVFGLHAIMGSVMGGSLSILVLRLVPRRLTARSQNSDSEPTVEPFLPKENPGALKLADEGGESPLD
jgi:hypothetical protein